MFCPTKWKNFELVKIIYQCVTARRWACIDYYYQEVAAINDQNAPENEQTKADAGNMDTNNIAMMKDRGQ